MAYKALYRTYRPDSFDDVVGQEHVVRTLLNSVRQKKVGHAYLFSGPRGTGKTTVARLLARVINCSEPVDGQPCSECDRCKGVEEGLGVLEIDAASHGSVDDMRQLVAQVSQVPLSGGIVVYIIDEVHMLSKEAFNAFLKTLEEPPPHAVFVLATTEPGKLLPTIHSRCQHFAFRRLPVDLLAKHVGNICTREEVGFEEPAIRLIARAGDGSVRDCISILEQAIAYEPDGLTKDGVRDVLGIPDKLEIRKLGGHIIYSSPGDLSEVYSGLLESGREPLEILNQTISHFRDLLFSSLDIRHDDLEVLPSEELVAIREQSSRVTVDQIHRAISFLAKCEADIKREDEAALLLEVSFLRLATRLGKVEDKPAPVDVPAEEPIRKTTGAAPSLEPVKQKPEPEPERKSLAGGLTLKRDLPREPVTKPSEKQPVKEVQTAEAPKSASATDTGTGVEWKESDLLKIPTDTEKFWKDTLESIRELSVADYVLLAEATPSPTPSEWPVTEGTGVRNFIDLVLKYPYEAGLQVRLLNNPTVLNRLTVQLEGVTERQFELKIARGRKPDNPDPVKKNSSERSNLNQGEENTAAQGPALFPGAARPIPSDPDLREIHNLIVEEFPDYRIESGGQ